MTFHLGSDVGWKHASFSDFLLTGYRTISIDYMSFRREDAKRRRRRIFSKSKHFAPPNLGPDRYIEMENFG